MLTKIVGSYRVGFDNLLAQTILVSMWINISATDSEEIQNTELMETANYCSTCLFRQNTALTFVM